MFELLLLCCWLAFAPAVAQEQVDPAVLRARLQQEILPSLGARTQAARARSEASEAWYAGEGSWAEAFPALVGAPIGDPSFLRAHAWQLQLRAEGRASQQAVATPSGLEAADAELLSPWRRALGEACDAEERADLLEQRFVAGLRAALERAPGLQDSAVQAQLDGWARVRAETPQDQPSPDQLALAAAAGLAAGELERLRQQAWRAATVPGDLSLILAVQAQAEPAPELLPADPAVALSLAARVDRLQRVAPLLPRDLAAQIEVLGRSTAELELRTEKLRLEAALADQAAAEPIEDLPVAQLELQVQQLHQTLEQAREELGAELVAAGQDGLQHEVAQLRVWLDEKRLVARQTALDRAKRLATTGLEHSQSGAKVAAARAEADLARQRADEDTTRASQAEAELRERVVQLRQEIADLMEAEAARREASVAAVEALGEDLEAQASALSAAQDMPPLDSKRQPGIDASYLALRAVVDGMRAELRVRVVEVDRLRGARRERLARLHAEQPTLEESLSTSALVALLSDAQVAQGDLEAVLLDREQAAADELDALLALLHRARAERRDARADASAFARREVSRAFLPELVAELGELPVRAGSTARHAGPWLRSLPSRLLDLGAIWVLLAGSVELLLLALLWVWLSRAAPTWVHKQALLAREASQDRDARGLPRWLAQQARRWLEPGDLGRLGPSWGALSQALVGVLASWQLARLLADAPALIALAAWSFAAVVLWRALPPLVSALFAVPDEERPALRVVKPAVRELTLWSARLALGWWLVLVLSRLVALRVLDADRILELLGVLGTFAFWGLVVVLVYRWSPMLVAALGERPDSRLMRWAAGGSSSWLLRTLQGATALGLLLLQLVVRYGSRVFSGGPGMSWLAALVARRQLRDASERQGEPLPAPVAERMRTLRPPLPGLDDLKAQILAELEGWREQRRRGLQVLTSDRGMGKTTLLGRIAHDLVGEYELVSLSLDQAVEGPEGARAWLAAKVLGRSGVVVPSRAELIDEISLLPGPRVFLVDGMERLFLREVGGFQALREMLQVLHATSDEHFWVCCFHGPTWTYLRGVPGVFDPAYFERVHVLPPRGPDALARWLTTTAQQAEYELSFDDLAGIGPNTVEADRLRIRAEAAYWRLLADSSAGNPEVARDLWIAGMTVDGDRLRMGLFDAPAAAQLQDLSDNELFVLTAVVVHDRLSVDHLARALNLPRSGVRTACQRLVGRGVLSSDGYEVSSLYVLQLPWLPAVQRHLRNKNFLAAR